MESRGYIVGLHDLYYMTYEDVSEGYIYNILYIYICISYISISISISMHLNL